METRPDFGFSSGKTLGVILIYFALFVVGELASSLLFDLIFSVVTLPDSALYQIPRYLGSLALIWLLFWLYTVKVLRLEMRSFGMTARIKPWCAVCAVLLPAGVICALLPFGSLEPGGHSWAETALIAAASAAMAVKSGITEEMLFRGYIMRLVEARWGRAQAVLLPSLLFGLVHLTSMTAFSPAGVALLAVGGTLVGVMFSLVAYSGGSVACSAAVHAVWNFAIISDMLHITAPGGSWGAPVYELALDSGNIFVTGGEFGVEVSLAAIAGYALVSAFAAAKRPR